MNAADLGRCLQPDALGAQAATEGSVETAFERIRGRALPVRGRDQVVWAVTERGD